MTEQSLAQPVIQSSPESKVGDALPEPGRRLYDLVRSQYVARGTTLTEWARKKKLPHYLVRNALIGMSNGPAARKLRAKVIAGAGL